MSSRKNLKKAIKGICGELFADCVALSSLEGTDRTEDIQKLMAQIAVMYQDYVGRTNTPEPGMPPRKYYQKLRADFTQQANALAQDILEI